MNATEDGHDLLGSTFPVEIPPWTPAQITYVAIGAILALMAFAEIFAFTGAVSYAFIKVHQKARRWGERCLSLFIMVLWWFLRAIFLFGMLSLVPVPHYQSDALLPDGLRQASVYVAFSLVLILLIVPSFISIQQLITAPSNMKERLESIRDTASFPRVLIVMPVYNELPEILHVAICSVIDGEYPKEHVHIFISFDNDAVSELYLALIASLGVPESEHYPPVIDLYYRGVQITVSRFPHGGKRLTQKKTFALIGTIYKDYPEKTDHLFVLFIDSDILLHSATLGNFMWEMELKPGSRKDMLGMTGVITVTTKQNMSFIALLQDMEYVHGQFFGRAIESAVGGVICLPGALTMFRYSAFLKSSDEYFAERDAKDLWDFGRSHLGEDRYLTHLLMAGAKRPKMIQFCHRATCKTEPVMEWRNLLKQRRRWFLGFITNESSLLSDPLMWRKYPFLLAFRMLQNIVFGTSMIAYLIIVAVITGTQNMSWVWLSLLGVYFLTNWMLMLTYGIWLGRRKAWLYPIMFIIGPIVSWFLLVYGVWTANERTWGGPRADASKAAEEGENHQPVEEGAAVVEEHLKDDHDDDNGGDQRDMKEKQWSHDYFFNDLTDDETSQLDTDMSNQSDNDYDRPPQLQLQLHQPPIQIVYVDDEQDNEDAKTFRTAHEDMDADTSLSPRVSAEYRAAAMALGDPEVTVAVRGRLSTSEPATYLSLNLARQISVGDRRSQPKLGQPAARRRRVSTISVGSASSVDSDSSASSTSSKSTMSEYVSDELQPDEDCLVIHPLGLSSTPRVDKGSQWWLDSEQLENLGIVPFTQRPKVPEEFASVETLILSPVQLTETTTSNLAPQTRPKLENRKSTSAVPTRSSRASMHESKDHKPRNSVSYGNLKSRTMSFIPSADMPMPGPSTSKSTPSTPFLGPAKQAFSTPSANGSFVSLTMPPSVLDNTIGSSSSNGSSNGVECPTPRQRRMSIMPSNTLSMYGSPVPSPSPVFQYIPSAYITPTHSAPASPKLPPTSPPSLPNSPALFPYTPSSLSLNNSPRDSPSPDGKEQQVGSSSSTRGRSGRSRVATAHSGPRSRSHSQPRSRASLAALAVGAASSFYYSSSSSSLTATGSTETDAQRKVNKRLSKHQVQQQSISGVSSSLAGTVVGRPSFPRTTTSISLGSASQEEHYPPSSSSSPCLVHRSSSSASSRSRRASLDSSAIVTTAVSFTKDGIIPPVPPLPRSIPVQDKGSTDNLSAIAHGSSSGTVSRSGSNSGGSDNGSNSLKSVVPLRPALTPRNISLVAEGKSRWTGSDEDAGSPIFTAAKAIVTSSSSSSFKPMLPVVGTTKSRP
ncbi:hypothetical protein DFQ26_003540 [Actinomortierella ambigua]|nr:hypothetical protein DFQ26_003540 [Actinomortierella ambigua]